MEGAHGGHRVHAAGLRLEQPQLPWPNNGTGVSTDDYGLTPA